MKYRWTVEVAFLFASRHHHVLCFCPTLLVFYISGRGVVKSSDALVIYTWMPSIRAQKPGHDNCMVQPKPGGNPMSSPHSDRPWRRIWCKISSQFRRENVLFSLSFAVLQFAPSVTVLRGEDNACTLCAQLSSTIPATYLRRPFATTRC